MSVGFADYGALEVEELAVYGAEKGEESGAVGELGVYRFFEDREEFVEGAVKSRACALGVRGAKEGGYYFAYCCRDTCRRVLEDTNGREEGVDVREG